MGGTGGSVEGRHEPTVHNHVHSLGRHSSCMVAGRNEWINSGMQFYSEAAGEEQEDEEDGSR